MEPALDPPDPVSAPSDGAVELGVLGQIELRVGGSLVALAGRNQRAVLVALALHRRRPLSTERLVDLLWGETAPRTATTSVQNAISQLRKLLGTAQLVTTPAGYVLGLDEQRFDAGRFEQLVAGAGAGEPAERLRLLDEAFALWRGTPFADLETETFVQEEQRRLEELRLVATEERLDALIALDRLGEAIAELQAHVSRNPLRERPRGMLMLALYRAGRQADALAVFQETRATLVEELGIEPGPELRAIHAAVLRQERSLRPVSAEVGIDDHLDRVARAILDGRVVPILGQSAMHEESEVGWRAEGRAPTAIELAAHLAARFGLGPEDGQLARVSEMAAATDGVGALYDELDAVFRGPFEPGVVHRFLAELPALSRARGGPLPLLVTTALDSMLERALEDAGEQADIVRYIASGPSRGRFAHVTTAGDHLVIAEPNAYGELSFARQAVVLRAHGGPDTSPTRAHESFVVTEGDHIDYLVDVEPAAAIPVTLAARLRRSHILFLGYDVADWSLRVLLHRIWGNDRLGYRSWAVAADANRLTRELWTYRDVDLFELSPAQYVSELRERVVAHANGGHP